MGRNSRNKGKELNADILAGAEVNFREFALENRQLYFWSLVKPSIS
jgi:hypothetical protein